MGQFDDAVEQRFTEIRAADRIEAVKEIQTLEQARQDAERLAADIDQIIGTQRLVVTVVAADEVFEAFAKFVVEIRHRRTDIVLGHVLQRDFASPPRFTESAPPTEVTSAASGGARIAYFFEPTILYEDMELQGYVCDTIDEIYPIQFDRPAFLGWLYNELVEITAAHELETRG